MTSLPSHAGVTASSRIRTSIGDGRIMSQRDFYLAAYDISEDRRLAAALHLVRGYATGGQKSVHEVFLSAAEKDELLHEMALILDEEEDRFFLLRLDPRARTYALGIALQPADPEYFYVG